MSSRDMVHISPRSALAGGISRVRFFDGMLLTQADLEGLEAYHRMKRQLTNRALGRGVVWGLRTEIDPPGRGVRLHPGYALDCCGNDLVVTQSADVSFARLIEEASDEVRAHLARATASKRAAEVSLVLSYVECPTDPVSVTSGVVGARGDACEPSRVRETTRLALGVPRTEPCGPVSTFLAELETLRTEHPELFPREPPSEAGVGLVDEVPLSLTIRFGRHQQTYPVRWRMRDGVGQIFAEVDEVVFRTGAEEPPLPKDHIEIDFELTPAPGWVITEGGVLGPIVEDTPTDETGMPFAERVVRTEGPFGLHLGWSWRIADIADILEGRFASVRLGIGALRIEPLFSRSGGIELSGSSTLEIGGSVRVLPVHYPGAAGVSFSAAAWIAGARRIEADDESCLGFFRTLDLACIEGGTERTVKTLVLAALGGFLTDELQRAIALRDPREAHGTARLAAWLYALAWRVFFGADVTGSPDSRAELGAILARLFDRWCRSLLYPGPRCDDGEHGVVIGSLRLERGEGGVSYDVDPWSGRRYVVTGAWLGHVMSSVGVAPIDVIVGRFAQSICCLGGIPPVPDLGSLPGLEHVHLTSARRDDAPALRGSEIFDAEGGTLHVGGAYVLFGAPREGLERLARLGVVVARTEVVSVMDLAQRVLEAFRTPAAITGRTRYVRYTVEGVGTAPVPMVLLPIAAGDVPPPVRRPLREPMERRFAEALREQPLAREALAELMDVWLHGIALAAQRRLDPSRPAVKLALEALSRAQLASVGDLLSNDPETVLAQIAADIRSRAETRDALDVLRLLFVDASALEQALFGCVVKAVDRALRIDRRTTLVRSDLGGSFNDELAKVVMDAGELPFVSNEAIARIGRERASSVSNRDPQV